jgi:hypothetical protein
MRTNSEEIRSNSALLTITVGYNSPQMPLSEVKNRVPPYKFIGFYSSKVVVLGVWKLSLIMKKVVTLLLALLVSMAYGYETIALLSDRAKNMVCEGSSGESGEQTKTEKEKDMDDDEFFGQRQVHRTLVVDRTISIPLDRNHIFSSADFGAEIYSPPEPLLMS